MGFAFTATSKDRNICILADCASSVLRDPPDTGMYQERTGTSTTYLSLDSHELLWSPPSEEGFTGSGEHMEMGNNHSYGMASAC